MKSAPGKKFLSGLLILALLLAATCFLQSRHEPPSADGHPARVATSGPGHEQASAELGARANGNRKIDIDHRGSSTTELWVKPPDGPAVDVIDRLKMEAARGNGKANLLIFLKLDDCLNVIGNSGDESRTAMLRKMGADIPTALEDMERRLEECDGLTDPDYKNRGNWLRAAADSGDEYAQLLYASHAEAVVGDAGDMMRDPERVIEYKRKAIAYLTTLAGKGNAKAWRRLSTVYDSGLLAPKDPVRAYAYFTADLMAGQRKGEPVSSSYPLQEALARNLSPQQRQEANRLAKEIFESCCS